MLVISICAVICRAEHWTEMEEFGTAKRECFASFLELENEIASHDTFRRVLILLESNRLKALYVEWIGAGQ